MKNLIKKFWRVSTLKYLVAFLIPLIFVLSINHSLDSDSWYVLAEGRYIAENGVFYEDVLSMHEGLNVVVQNYGFAVIFYWIFSVFGGPGVYIAMLILNFLVCFLLYKICMLLSNKNVNLSLLIMIITDMVLALEFVVTRAQMVSFVFFLVLIYILELYIKNKRIMYLWWIPVMSFLQINLHASLWLMIFLVLGVYIVDSINKPKLRLQGYRTWPLVLVGFISVLVGLINPYGIRMMTFILASYFSSVLKILVVELESFSPFASLSAFVIYLCIIAVSLLTIFANKKRIRIRYCLMFFGFLALGLNTIKGLSQFILVMFFPLAYYYKDVKIEKVFDKEIVREMVMIWCGIIAICLGGALLPIVVSQVKSEPESYLVEAVDSIDKDVGDNLKSDYAVYTVYVGYDPGGYLEYRGYKPYIDSRGEYFLKSVNKKEDILEEYADFIGGRISSDEMLEKYNFDYLLVYGEWDPFYRLNDERYRELYNNEEYKTRVFVRVKNEK